MRTRSHLISLTAIFISFTFFGLQAFAEDNTTSTKVEGETEHSTTDQSTTTEPSGTETDSTEQPKQPTSTDPVTGTEVVPVEAPPAGSPCDKVIQYCDHVGWQKNDSTWDWGACVKGITSECFKEDHTEEWDGVLPPKDPCEEVFRACEGYGHKTPASEDCIKGDMLGLAEEGVPCAHEWKRRHFEKEEKQVPFDWVEEAEEEVFEEEADQEYGEEDEDEWEEEELSEQERWFEDFEEAISSLEGEEKKCAEEVMHAKKTRCKISSVHDCVAKTAYKAIVEEGKCRLNVSEMVEVEEEYYEDYDYEYEPEPGDHDEGCVPWHLTRKGVAEMMMDASPKKIEEKYREGKHWMAKEAERFGVPFEETIERFEEMNVCPEMFHGPGGSMGPPPGMIGSMHGPVPDMGHGPIGEDIGRVFGEAVGMLVSLTQDPHLPDDLTEEVNEALAWFSEKVGAIAKGEDAMQFIGEAKERLHRIMDKKGGPGFGGPSPEEAEREIKKVLDMFGRMLEAVPKAFARMQELFSEEGIEVDFGGEWKEIHKHLKKEHEHIKNKCSEAMESNEFHRCFESFHEFPMQMEKLKFHVEDILKRSGVPMSTMGRIMMMIGEEFFDEFEKGPNGPGGPPDPPGMMGPPMQGPPSDFYGPPPGEGEWGPPPMHDDMERKKMECKKLETEAERSECFDRLHKEFDNEPFMGPPPGMMGPPTHSPMPMYPMEPGTHQPPPHVPDGFHVPDPIKDVAGDCYAEGGTDEECKQKVMEKMLEDMLRCDEKTGGDFEKCKNEMYEEFNVQEGDTGFPGAP